MAILQDLTVYGATRLISDTFAANLYSDGFHHNGHDNDDSVLLAGGGYQNIITLLQSGYWANLNIQNSPVNTAQPRFGSVGINAAVNANYKLYVSGTANITTSILSPKHLTANYEISESTGSRLAFGNAGQTLAKGINVGDLLVSNAWADYTKVPTNGIYSKGQIKLGVTTGTAPFDITSTTVNTNLNADLLDGFHESYFAVRDKTYGTDGKIDNCIYEYNDIARGDLGTVGFDNSSLILELYEATSGNSYPSSPNKTITENTGYHIKYGLINNIHTTNTGSKLKLVISSGNSHYIKAVALWLNTQSTTMTCVSNSVTSTIQTDGSWHILSNMQSSNSTSITLEINTTNVNKTISFRGIRLYITNPSNLRFPGSANYAEASGSTDQADEALQVYISQLITGDNYGPILWSDVLSTSSSYENVRKSYDHLLWNPYRKSLNVGENNTFGDDEDDDDLNDKYMYAFGYNNTVKGYGVFAAGHKVSATGDGAHAVGEYTEAVAHSHAEGYYAKALNDYSHAEGYCTTATGEKSHVEGHYTQATRTAAHAEGYSTIASGLHSHAEGNETEASGGDSHAEGDGTVASNMNSHAEGFGTIASGESSHAEGYHTEAHGNYSHAEGENTKAGGTHSHAEGINTIASGAGSHAEGASTLASGLYSHASGLGTIASNPHEFACGQYNKSNQGTRFSVGIGNYDSNGNLIRKNIFEILSETSNLNRLYGGVVKIGTEYEDFVPGQNNPGTNYQTRLYVGGCIRITGAYNYFQNDISLVNAKKLIYFGDGNLVYAGEYVNTNGSDDPEDYDYDTDKLDLFGNNGIYLHSDEGNIGIETSEPQNKLDVNGIAQIYQRGNDNTAFKNLFRIKQQNSTEASGDNWVATNPSFGIGFNRYWTSNGEPSGETNCAGIYATVSSSWRGGLVFRTKNNTTQGGTHDITAFRLAPSGAAYANHLLPFATNSKNLGSGSLRWAKLYIGTTDSYGDNAHPIYWDNGVPKATTYTLSSTINGGTANRMAYYSGANALSAATSIYATGDSLAINGIGITSGYNFEVNGSSVLRLIVPQLPDTYDLGLDTRRWKFLYSGEGYFGTASGAQCHLKYDTTDDSFNFIFD